MTVSRFYQNGREHLNDELSKLDALLQSQISKHREGTSGLYISDDEVDRITGEENSPDTDRIKALIDNSLKAGIDLPLLRLASMFQLSSIESDIILLCLAPELDLKYEKLYAYLQDDVTKKSPSVNFILDLLCHNLDERTVARVCFMDDSPLLKYGLVTSIGDVADVGGDQNQPGSLLSRCLKLDDRITNFLLGFNGLDSRLSSFARIIRPQRKWESLIMEPRLKEQFSRLASHCLQESSETGQRHIFYLKGPYGVGKRSAAEVFCCQLQIPLILVDTGNLLVQNKNSETDVQKVVTRLFRETLFQEAAIYFEGFDRLIAYGSEGSRQDEEQLATWKKRIIEAVKEFAFITFFAGEAEWYSPAGFEDQTFVKIELPVPSYPLRKRLWKQSLNGRFPLAPGIDIDEIANKFNFTAGQIRDALTEARNRALMRGSRGSDNGAITMDDLYHSCHCQSNQKLSKMAQKIKPKYSWADIVLPLDKLQQLAEICSHVRYRQVVYSEWGFGAKFSLGKGLNILFSGPSGTGKTMGAEVIAGNLGLELYKLDLSNVVSKYIGETEKNLNRIFKEAETANCILFFDEADALFGKRSEVKDAHDRYANIEINYLLQKMEEHEGIVILATNFLKNIDEAFKRRIHFSIDFPFPDEIYRLKIWQNIFPPEMPRSTDIDFEFLAKKFKLSGGNIKNIAVNAAFLAAEKSRQVDMSYAIQATRRELQKMGKHCSPSDFGKYYDFIVPRGGDEIE